jgi:hypothetical protein
MKILTKLREKRLTFLYKNLLRRGFHQKPVNPCQTLECIKTERKMSCLPVKSVFTFGAEEVDVIFELQFENKVFVNVIPFVG